ncbi:MAG TPA: DUF2269 domain-containing protein [Chloroflexota bacterium]|nr:DUF2269 domain-containing protein [Chloroflexota bacterium]
MILSPGWRKLTLTVHLTASVGWIGAVVAYLALGVSAVTAPDDETLRAAWIAMEVTGWYAIVPLAIGSLVTGVVISLGTPWGLFRHYWVIISLGLTSLCLVVLLAHMPGVSATAAALRSGGAAPAAPRAESAEQGRHGGARAGDLFHPSAGLVILLAVAALNVYKPRGLTPYGWRKQQAELARRSPGDVGAAARLASATD